MVHRILGARYCCLCVDLWGLRGCLEALWVCVIIPGPRTAWTPRPIDHSQGMQHEGIESSPSLRPRTRASATKQSCSSGRMRASLHAPLCHMKTYLGGANEPKLIGRRPRETAETLPSRKPLFLTADMPIDTCTTWTLRVASHPLYNETITLT